MPFKKKIALSLVTIALLASCATEDKYAANAIPIVNIENNNSDDIKDDNVSRTEIKISFRHQDRNLSWQKNDLDEQTQGLAFSASTAVIYSKWDNRLQIVDPSTKTVSSDKRYLDVEGNRYSSGETPRVDDISGASEQILEKVFLNESASSVYSLLVKYGDESKDIGIGIYADDIGNGIPDARFARRGNSSANYYNYPKIKDMALSHNGTQLVAVGDDRKIRIFDANSLNAPSEIDTGKKMRSVNFSMDDKHVFTGMGGLSSYIQIYNLASKEKVAELKTKETPKAIVEIPEQNKIIVIFNDSNKIRIYDISDISNLVQSKLLIINGKAKSIAISPDKKTFAIVATGKQVNLFSIDGSENPKVIHLAEECYGASFVDEKKLITVGKTSMEFFDIKIESIKK